MKKIFHFLFFLFFSVIQLAIFILLYRQVFLYAYHLDIVSKKTLKLIAEWWNNGGVASSKDLLMLLSLFIFFVLYVFFEYKLYNCKYINFLTGPINWYLKKSISKYKPQNVNIKNLKIEEKKTIEQLVQERIEQEKKKQSEKKQIDNSRNNIINEIENKLKK